MTRERRLIQRQPIDLALALPQRIDVIEGPAPGALALASVAGVPRLLAESVRRRLVDVENRGACAVRRGRRNGPR